MLQAVVLRDVLREASSDPAALVHEFDRRTEDTIAPWYHSQIAADHARFDQMEALRQGREPRPPAEGLAQDIQQLQSAMLTDPDLFRIGLEYAATLTPIQQIVRRPGAVDRIRAAARAVSAAPVRPFPRPRSPAVTGARVLTMRSVKDVSARPTTLPAEWRPTL
jgi:hypothetical protein